MFTDACAVFLMCFFFGTCRMKKKVVSRRGIHSGREAVAGVGAAEEDLAGGTAGATVTAAASEVEVVAAADSEEAIGRVSAGLGKASKMEGRAETAAKATGATRAAAAVGEEATGKALEIEEAVVVSGGVVEVSVIEEAVEVLAIEEAVEVLVIEEAVEVLAIEEAVEVVVTGVASGKAGVETVNLRLAVATNRTRKSRLTIKTPGKSIYIQNHDNKFTFFNQNIGTVHYLI